MAYDHLSGTNDDLVPATLPLSPTGYSHASVREGLPGIAADLDDVVRATVARL